MEKNFKLISEKEQVEIFEKLKYEYITSVKKDWKKQIPKLNILRSISVLKPIELNDEISDYELFKECYPTEADNFINHYFLTVDGKPVTYITSNRQENDMLDISFATVLEFQNLGYATKSLELLEDKLFSDNSIKGIQMIDLSKYNQTSKIAKKLNYELNEVDQWCKYNKNYINKNTIRR